jgi:hypothetical protein
MVPASLKLVTLLVSEHKRISFFYLCFDSDDGSDDWSRNDSDAIGANGVTTAASRATISEPRCYDTAIVFMLYAEGGMTKHGCTLLSTRRVPPSEYAACSLWWTVCVPKILKHCLVVFPKPTALLGLSSSSFFRENRISLTMTVI